MKNHPKSQHPSPPINPTQDHHLHQQLTAIQTDIITQLYQNSITIPNTKIPFTIFPMNKQSQNKNYHQLILEKKSMNDKLKNLEKQQLSFISKSKSKEKDTQNPIPFRSQLNEQDKQVLMKLRKKLMGFQKQISNKNKQLQQNTLKFHKQQQQKTLQQRAQTNQKKKLQITQNLKSLQSRILQRQNLKKQTDQALTQAEQQQRLYHLLNQHFKQKHKEQSEQQYQLMEKRNQEKYIDFQSLKQHEKKYAEILYNKKKQFQQKRLTRSKISQDKTHSLTKSTSKFYIKIIEEQKQLKLEQNKKKQIKKLLLLKKLSYSEQIRGGLSHKKKSTSHTEQPSLRQDKIVPLSLQQIHELGKQYLQSTNKNLKRKYLNQLPQNPTIITTNQTKIPHHLRPRDSLPLSRTNKQQENHFINYPNPKQQAEKIIQNDNMQPKDKINTLKILANKFDNSRTDIVTKIQGKLQILKAIH